MVYSSSIEYVVGGGAGGVDTTLIEFCKSRYTSIFFECCH